MGKNKLLSYLFLFLFTITFYFKGDTLYWTTDGYNDTEVQWLRFQLNKCTPPDMNDQPIKRIDKIGNDKLVIFTEDKYWILHYAGRPLFDWYVEDYKDIR